MTDVSLLSAPRLLLPFLAGCTQREPKRAAMLGFACTLSALIGYGLMTLSPLEHAQVDAASLFVVPAARTVAEAKCHESGAVLRAVALLFDELRTAGHTELEVSHAPGEDGPEPFWLTCGFQPRAIAARRRRRELPAARQVRGSNAAA